MIIEDAALLAESSTKPAGHVLVTIVDDALLAESSSEPAGLVTIVDAA